MSSSLSSPFMFLSLPLSPYASLHWIRSPAWGYFDGMVSSGQLPELVKRANDLDAEIKAGKSWVGQDVGPYLNLDVPLEVRING